LLVTARAEPAVGDPAPSIRALTLPVGFTIPPESDRRMMAIGGDGVIYGLRIGLSAASF